MNKATVMLFLSAALIALVYAKQPELPGVLLFGGIAFAFGLGALLFGWQAQREKRRRRYQGSTDFRTGRFKR